MRKVFAVLGWLASAAVAVALVTMLSPDVALASMQGMETIVVPALAGMGTVRYAVKTERIQALRRMATPQQSGDLEAVPWQIFHTLDFTSAVTTRLRFFAVPPVSINTGNMDTGGMLTAPNWFSIACFGFDVERRPTITAAAAATGATDDVQQLLLTGQPVWTLKISGKDYGPFRLSPIHGTGIAGGILSTGADESLQNSNAGPVGDGGWYWDHSVIIPPNVSFSVEVVWNAALTLTAETTPLTFSMFGTMFRRVL
jgi:hypothetical protein